MLAVCAFKRATAEGLAQALNKALGSPVAADDGEGEKGRDGRGRCNRGGKTFLAMPYHGKMSDADRSLAQVRPKASNLLLSFNMMSLAYCYGCINTLTLGAVVSEP